MAIPQPPHSAGQAYAGFRQRIDGRQIPSPIESQEIDGQAWADKAHLTLPGNRVPLATTDAFSIDQGNCAPKYIRVSTWNLPHSSRLASDCRLPLFAHFQPFAEQDPREEPVPLLDFVATGPPRCARCRAYINPWCPWTDGGNKWRCNLCKHETQVTPDYFSNLDANLMRLDHHDRPELSHGTVDFLVGEDYWAPQPPPHIDPLYDPPPSTPRTPQPINYVFLLDVSLAAVQSGFLHASCDALRHIIYGGAWPPASHLALLTYDRTLHFHDLRSDPAPMLVLPDVDDVFLPFRDGLFVDPMGQSRPALTALLAALPARFADTRIADSALGAAVTAGLAALSTRGGHILAFQAALPSVGLGALKNSGAVDGDSPPTPHSPFWPLLAERCAEAGVGVSLVLAPSSGGGAGGGYVDIGSIGTLPTTTGGEIFYHPRFDPTRDGPILTTQLRRLLTRFTGYNCMARVRCSNGLHPTTPTGTFFQRSPTELEFGVLDADQAWGVGVEVGRGVDTREFAHIQLAVLYTTSFADPGQPIATTSDATTNDGSTPPTTNRAQPPLYRAQRRVRVCNLAIQTVELAGNVFHAADMEAVVAGLGRGAASALLLSSSTSTKLPTLSSSSSTKLPALRDGLTEQTAMAHLGYRERCAQASGPGQLIIPEALKGLLAHTLGLLKTKALKPHPGSASDARAYAAHKLLRSSVRGIVRRAYPRVMALHDLDEGAAVPVKENGQEAGKTTKIIWPSLMRASHLFMEAHGVYLADNEELQVLWIGSAVAPQLLLDLFGVDDVFGIDMGMSTLPVLPTLLSTQVRNILARRCEERGGRTLPLLLARQNLDAAEIEFADMLVEDQNNGAMSYVDYMTLVHKKITHILTEGQDPISLRGHSSIW
ncbi:hypothetical protein BD626DRAFT_458744 [Schizophyllum amplum]|uniref:Sec23/Sec24 trunk domain-containing protein n=1 Tax=Schizophyllum amplum TaxID=97359 RepID=A0A550CC01_9AGAR|nr:hypothetical protein BD626DRAFT_458744 [Auriculariopsis ampla]